MGTLTNLIATSNSADGAVYTVATTEPDRTATVTVSTTSRGLRVGLDLGSGGPSVRTVYEAFDAVSSAHYLGAGEQRDHVDLRGTVVPIKVWATCGTSKVSPFYLSSQGYGAPIHHDGRGPHGVRAGRRLERVRARHLPLRDRPRDTGRPGLLQDEHALVRDLSRQPGTDRPGVHGERRPPAPARSQGVRRDQVAGPARATPPSSTRTSIGFRQRASRSVG